MKYHRLSKADLEELKDEFVKFLATNGLEAKEWEELKKEDPEKTDALIDQFSDLVIHRALTNIAALKLVTQNEVYVFHFEKEQAEVVHLKIGTDHDLTDETVIGQLASGDLPLKTLSPEVETGRKSLKGDREMEMYQLMVQGAKPCPVSFYEDFKKLIA